MAAKTTSRRTANGKAANGKAANSRATNGKATNGKAPNGAAAVAKNGRPRVDDPGLARLEHALQAAAAGDFGVRLPARRKDDVGRLEAAYNQMAARNAALEAELVRVAEIIGREGRMTERARLHGAGGAWSTTVDSVNGLIDDLVRPTTEVARVIVAVAEGDLNQKMALEIEGRTLTGEFLRTAKTVNVMVEQLSTFASEVTRVAREVGSEGVLGGQAQVKGVAGTWKDLTDSVNFMASNLTAQVRNIA
ncbi:MAG: HAMP domain-containing protein, partial [Solirubrobacterales bacterium]|nr:HAMP domain-containing protein [Solirubrobacterales bacterium]